MNPVPPTISNTFDWEDHLRSVVLDRESGISLHSQLRSSLRRIIRSAPDNIQKITPENSMVGILGVSQATVRKALDGLVEEGLIERRRALGTVIKRPAAAARLAHLAVIVPDFPSATTQSHVAALNAQASALGARVSLIALPKGESWRSSKRQLSFAASEGGVVLLGNSERTTIDLYHLLHEQGYSTVAIGTPLPGCPCNTVGIDNRIYVRTGLERLRQAGHRRIAFLVGEPEEVAEVQERVRCFEEEARDLGLDEAEVVHCGAHEWENPSEASTHTVAALWERPVRPTAIFGISDGCAAGALFGLTRLGVRVPEDVSILSYDGTDLTRIVHPKLDTLVTPMDRIAAAVISLFSSSQSQGRHIFLKPDYREGASVRLLP